jgi:hypothetical protein
MGPAGAALGQTKEPAPDPKPCARTIRLSGSLGDGANYALVADGDEATYLTPQPGWQFVQMEFGCPVKLNGLRRRMTQDGKRIDGRRDGLGEGVSYSLDGVRWMALSDENSSGWDDPAGKPDPGSDEPGRYPGHAWSAMPYGWSAWLHPNAPAYARIVRLNWRAAKDRLNEMETSYEWASPLDPLLWNLAAWDWTEPVMLAVHYDGDDRTHPGQTVALPWNDTYGECRQENPDIQPAEGWVLLAGNLGTELAKPLPDYPHFFMYNKYKGLIRAFFFYGARRNVPHTATHQMGALDIDGADIPAFAYHTAATTADFDPRYEEIFMKKHLQLDHWACLDFDVAGYDPAIADPSRTAATFEMHFQALAQSDVDLDVIGGLHGTLEAADVRTGRDGLSGLLDTVSSGGAQFLKAVEIFDGAQEKLDKLGDLGNLHPTTWWGPPLVQAAQAATGDVPLLAAAAGFIASLLGGDDHEFPLSWRTELTGEFRINGTISTAPDLALVPFYVPGTIHGRDRVLDPLYDEPLGIYALTERPLIDWWNMPFSQRGVQLSVDPASIIINPHSGLRLISAKAALVSPRYRPRRFSAISAFAAPWPPISMSTTEFNTLRVGLLLELERIDRPGGPTLKFYQEYEATKEANGVYGDF